MEVVKSVGRLLRFNTYCGCAGFTEDPLRSTSTPCVGMSEIFLGPSLRLTDSSRRYSTTIVPVDDIVSLFPSIFSETTVTPMLGRFRGGLSEPRGDTIGGEVRSAPGVELIRGVELCVHCLGVWLPEALFEMGVNAWGLRGGLCSAGFAGVPVARERALGLGEPGRTSGAGACWGDEGVAVETWRRREGCEEEAVEAVEAVGAVGGTAGTEGGERTGKPCLAGVLCEGCEGCEGCGGWTGWAG